MSTPDDAAQEELKRIAREAMLARGLLPEFSRAVHHEASAFTRAPTEHAPAIRDLCGLPWASIDNDDSRDLDQLTVAQPLADGAVRVLVAVADVDAAVKPGSAIDGHASANTTSVYTAAQVFPMLPERLSTDLTSLNESEVRLAMIIEMDVAADGNLSRSDVYRAAVQSRAQLTYNAVAAWLDGQGQMPPKVAAVPGLDEQLRVQDRTAQALKRLRHERGALRLRTSEARPVFEHGRLTDLRPDDKNRAKELIEDFMIAANGVTARFLDRCGFPSLRRMLHTPKRWARIVELAAGLGERLPAEPDAAALDSFLAQRRAQDAARFAELSLSVLKLLGSGEYIAQAAGRAGDGHFGLAVNDYAHSTAPNRRYPDLVTQRLLKSALGGERVPYTDDELAALARHCTVQEDNAAKVERQVRKSAAALLLAPRIGESFDAIVTGASAKGTWVRITRPTVEGKVVRGFEGLDVGDRVRVELVEVNAARGFIDFQRARG